jgi:hypothetical protein
MYRKATKIILKFENGDLREKLKVSEIFFNLGNKS